MTKAELIKAWKEAAGITTVHAEEYLKRLGDIMVGELLGGGEVPLPGIGRLVVRQAAARTGRNPRTGKVIDIPARKKVVLKVGKELKDFLK